MPFWDRVPFVDDEPAPFVMSESTLVSIELNEVNLSFSIPNPCKLLFGLFWTLAARSGRMPLVAQSFPVDPSLPLVTGAFLQPNNSVASKSAVWWQTELGSTKKDRYGHGHRSVRRIQQFVLLPDQCPGRHSLCNRFD
jgi:hypothetical protein